MAHAFLLNYLFELNYLFNAKKRTCLPIFLFEISKFEICLSTYASPVFENKMVIPIVLL